MKKLIVFAATVLSVAAGCKKDNALKSLNQQIAGKWELAHSFSGWSGSVEYAPGNGNTISFESGRLVQRAVYNDTSFTIEAAYNIYKGKPCDFAAETTLLHFSTVDGLGYDQEIVLADGELKIGSTECIADGGTSYYRKIE